MKKKIINQLLIDKNSSIKQAMRAMDRTGWGMGFIIDEEKKLFGVITSGDIRRTILKGVNIAKKSIGEVCNKKPIVVHEKTKQAELIRLKTREDIKEKIPIGGSLKIPVVDGKGKIKDIVFFYETAQDKPKLNKDGIRKILLIGGAGYLGSVLCRKLLNQGYEVRVLDNLTYGDWGIRELYKKKNFEFLKGDIRNISDIVKGIKGVDAVIHLAAIVGDPLCALNPKRTLEINYLATKIIVEICKYFQINRFIFASTCSVYGRNSIPDTKLNEESLLNPISLYAETKIKCENLILEAMDENFSPTIFRMATLYGYSPNMRLDLVINLLTAKALFDKEITIFGGEQWRPWLSLEDASDAYISSLKNPIKKIRGEIFNVLSENYKIIEVGRKINSICPYAKIKINKKKSDNRNYNVSFDKISQILNFHPKKKITNGVIEIKKAIEKGLIKNSKDPKYRISLP